jgi:hypothetical protein
MKYWINRIIREDLHNPPILLRQGREIVAEEDTVLNLGYRIRTLNG